MDVVESKNDKFCLSSTLIIEQPELTRSRFVVPPTNGFIGPGVKVANNLPPDSKKNNIERLRTSSKVLQT